MDALQAIENRKSVRGYTGKKVEKAKLETLAKAGCSAPKAGNFHISVITNPALLREIDEKALAAMKSRGGFSKQRAELEGYGAPALFLISASDASFKETNASCAATTITVAAIALELASCYVVSPVGAFKDDPSLGKRAGIPEGYAPVCGVLAGYAGEDKFSNTPPHTVTVGYVE
ncbi:nitroreductase family protein [Spirochaetia bacterium]|nr:nitroreductase family protein [Spirochaetia bacterium]